MSKKKKKQKKQKNGGGISTVTKNKAIPVLKGLKRIIKSDRFIFPTVVLLTAGTLLSKMAVGALILVGCMIAHTYLYITEEAKSKDVKVEKENYSIFFTGGFFSSVITMDVILKVGDMMDKPLLFRFALGMLVCYILIYPILLNKSIRKK